MKRSVFIFLKCWLVCGVLGGVACQKAATFPNSSEIFQKMQAREKALSSFSIQVHTEEVDGAVEHAVIFRAPDFVRVDVKQPQKLSLSFDGQNYYRLEELAKKLTIFNLHLPTAERKIALSMLMGAFVPEGFQLPRVVPKNLKQSWPESKTSGRTLRLENHLSDGRLGDGSEGVTLAYELRWPSLDFLKKEVFVDGRKMEFVMQEEHCLPENNLCLPTLIVAKQDGEVLAPQKMKLLSFQETVSNEHFVLQAPEGFVIERHTLSSLKELESL